MLWLWGHGLWSWFEVLGQTDSSWCVEDLQCLWSIFQSSSNMEIDPRCHQDIKSCPESRIQDQTPSDFIWKVVTSQQRSSPPAFSVTLLSQHGCFDLLSSELRAKVCQHSLSVRSQTAFNISSPTTLFHHPAPPPFTPTSPRFGARSSPIQGNALSLPTFLLDNQLTAHVTPMAGYTDSSRAGKSTKTFQRPHILHFTPFLSNTPVQIKLTTLNKRTETLSYFNWNTF